MGEIIQESGIRPSERIVNFINEHHLLALSTVSGNKPYAASCFYVYLEEECCFVFTTDFTTRHGEEMKANSNVSAIIALETSVVGKIRGLQVTGNAYPAEGEINKRAKHAYLKKFPVAMLLKTTLWIMEVDMIKMTDNRLGFGKKLIWEKQV